MADTINNLDKLTTPEEYVNYYFDQLKDSVDSRGLQVSKVGLIGYLLNILGSTQFDVKQYFDMLFREAFLATTVNDENLGLHAKIHGYDLAASNPSKIVGTMVINLDNLPTSFDEDNRQIVISDLIFDISGIKYTLDSKYTIVGNNCQVQTSENRMIYVPYNVNSGQVPVIDLIQYYEFENTFTLPYYQYGLYYQKIINIDEDISQNTKIYQMEIEVTLENSDTPELFTIKKPKYLTKSTEKMVFVEYLSDSRIQIEFGSGLHGLHVPGASVTIRFKLTNGSEGNILTTTAKPIEGTVKVFEGDGNYEESADDVITLNVDYGEGGSDILSGDDLREDVINYIQTRGNLISDVDFYNFIGKEIKDFLILFKKTGFNDNIIYLFQKFNDKYQVPVFSKSISMLQTEFNPSSYSFLFKPSFTIDGIDYVSPFVYIYDPILRCYLGYIYQENLKANFSDITYEDLPESEVSLLPSINLSFDLQVNNNRTAIAVESYQNISDYRMFLTIEELGIDHVCMDDIDDNKKLYYYINNLTDGVILNCFSVEVEVRKDDEILYTVNLDMICLNHDVTDILTIKTYDHSVSGTFNTYVVYVPVMFLEDYENDIDYYDNKLLGVFGDIVDDGNRMISDDLQVRFLNTEIIPGNYLQDLSVQKYDFDLVLPLKMNIEILINQDYIVTNEIDVTSKISDLKVDIASTLFNEHTGINISFYYTKIVDIIHILPWVRSCIIKIFDSSNIPIEIGKGNIETISQYDMFKQFTSKLDNVTYCPIYFYWDLDNIDVTTVI